MRRVRMRATVPVTAWNLKHQQLNTETEETTKPSTLVQMKVAATVDVGETFCKGHMVP